METFTEHSNARQCTCDESGVVWRDGAVISLLVAAKARHSGTVRSDRVHKRQGMPAKWWSPIVEFLNLKYP